MNVEHRNGVFSAREDLIQLASFPADHLIWHELEPLRGLTTYCYHLKPHAELSSAQALNDVDGISQ